MAEKKKFSDWLSGQWLFLLLVLQPLLDVLAYWTRSEEGTAAGYVRLAIMLILPCWLLFTAKDRKRFLPAMILIAVIAMLHVGNLFRLGYVDFLGDIKNMAKIFFMPVMAVCLCTCVRDENTSSQLVKGLYANAIILAAVILISYVTGTYNPTYGHGLGTSAWVTDANRCTHSIILSALSIFAMYFSLRKGGGLAAYAVPAAVFAACVSNGTSSCYLTCLTCFIGFAAFLIFRALVTKERLDKQGKWLVVYLVALFVLAIAIYPVTPRAKITAIERAAAEKRQNTLEEELIALGYDIRNMSPEEKMNEPVVREKMAKFYTETIYGGAPALIESFDVYRIMETYGMSTDANRISDVRRMKRVNARLIWEDSDMLTKLTGFEFSKVDWPGLSMDLENDWHAIFYYYGVVGFAAYVLYMLSFLVLVAKKLRRNFQGNLTLYHFALLLCFFILLGLAHFSGALLKRPNSSIYLAVLLALIHYQCRFAPDKAVRGDCL